MDEIRGLGVYKGRIEWHLMVMRRLTRQEK